MKFSRHELIEIQNISDSRGSLHVIDFSTLIGFDPVRVFTIQDVPKNTSRGKHAHKHCIQVLHCLIGAVEAKIEFKGSNTTVLLDSPKKVLYVPPLSWLEMKFLEGATILTVYASEVFLESDYLRDYSEFLKINDESQIK
jgi:hypothetical protein